jgi:hypothetical protein
VVTGDAVNLCHRIADTARPGEIRLTRAAFIELPGPLRSRCHGLPAVHPKGVPEEIEVVAFDWRDRSVFPSLVRIEETGEELALPDRETIRFGRLRDKDGTPANDVVLSLPDRQANLQISRWHFELRRRSDGFLLRPVSDQSTEVDGVSVERGAEVPIRPGTVVRAAHAITLRFLASAAPVASDDATMGPMPGPRSE